jgi:hypothetical protein
LICQANLAEQRYECNNCQNTSNICQVKIPYAAKLLIQELMAMQLAPRLRTSIIDWAKKSLKYSIPVDVKNV